MRNQVVVGQKSRSNYVLNINSNVQGRKNEKMNKGADKNFMQNKKMTHILITSTLITIVGFIAFLREQRKLCFSMNLEKPNLKMTQTFKKIIKNTNALGKSCQTKVLIIIVNEPEIRR